MTEENPYLRSLVIIANVIGLIYNIPQVILTIRTKSANDISGIFLILRIVSATLWIIYLSFIWNVDVFISWIITGLSSIILLYYKMFYSDKKILDEICFCKKQNRIELKDDPNDSSKV
jgi:uncharacterized protein with PQ loop repeat